MKPGLDHQIHHCVRKESGAAEASPPTGFCAIFVPVVDPDIHGLWMRTVIPGTRFSVVSKQRGKLQLDYWEYKQKCKCECRRKTSRSSIAVRTCREGVSQQYRESQSTTRVTGRF
jgi:hypothetical protein